MIKLNIDNYCYNDKPNKDDAKNLTYRIMKHPVNVTPEQLANEIIRGKSFVPAFLTQKGSNPRRCIENWHSQQVIALDFDNEVTVEIYGEKKKIKHVSRTIDDILNDELFKDNAAFAYTTFSHKEDHPKFRVVFILNDVMYNYNKTKELTEQLLEMYHDADKSCSDGSRLFYGGKELYIFNYNNRLDVNGGFSQDIVVNKHYMSTQKPLLDFEKGTKENANEYINKSLNVADNVELIKSKNAEELQESINSEPVTLYNYHQVYEYLKQQDLYEYLGVSKGSIYDIFHDESSPSAGIYQSKNGNGHYLYKCHSDSFNFVGTILQVTEKICNCSFVEARNFLMKVYNIEIKENDTQKELKEMIDAYKYILQSDEIKELYPNFYKLFGRYDFIDDLYILLDLIKENLPADSDDPRLIFFHSINTLAQKFGRSKAVTGTRMNFLTFFKMIYKLDESEIPKKLLDIQNSIKETKKYKYRSNTYEMKLYSYDFFGELDMKCKEWTDKGLTTKSMNYEGVLRNFGREEANRVFPQDKDKKVSELGEDVTSKIEKETMYLISEKGWTLEKEILDNVILYFKGQQKFKQDQIKRMIGEMLDKYGLVRKRLNKQLKTQMNIEVNGYPFIICKE